MSTHDLKLQQSSCQSGVKASVTCYVLEQEILYTQPDKSRFQNVSEHELHPGPLDHVPNKKDLETRTTTSSPSLQLTGQPKSSRDFQIKQIIILRPKEDLGRTSEEQKKSGRFTSTISFSLPNRRNKKDTAEEKTLQSITNVFSTHEAIKNSANQHHTELRDVFSPTEQCGESTGELFKNGDGPQASFDEESFTTLHQHGHNTHEQGQNTGIQHNIDLQIFHDNSQRHSTQPFCEVQTEFNKESGVSDCRENAATNPQYHSNLTSLEVDNGLKSSTDFHHSEVFSLDSFPASHSENTPEPEPDLISPSSDMLTSALASVLAPPWSGRLRRPKQGGSELQHEPQDCGQNVNPSTLFRQDRRQPFLPSHRRHSEHMLANDNNMRLAAGTSYNSPDWQKENSSPNITTTIQPKRPIIKSSSVGMMYNNTDLHPTSMDTHRVPNLPHSGYRISKAGDEHEPYKSLSSKPTTSSLLLSLRRSNLRSTSAEPTQSQTQMNRSARSLTLPSRVVLKTPSFARPVTPDDQTSEYPDAPAKTEEIPVSQYPFSPRIKNRVPLRASMFLNKPETEISKRLEASRAEKEHFPHSTNKTGQLGVPRAQQSSYLVLLRKYSSTEDLDSVDQYTANNTNLNKQQVIPDATVSPKDSTNFNVQQSAFNVQRLKSQSAHNIITSSSSGTSTFTDRLSYSPRKDSSADGSPRNVRQTYMESKKYSQSSQSSMDLSSPLSPTRPLRSVRVPSIYSYLRESSPAVSTPSPSTPSFHIQRGETSPPKHEGIRKTLPSKFSFDFNPSVPQARTLQRSSSSSFHVAPAHSLPPDFGRRSAPRLSTSPYTSLISSRPTLNNTLQELSSPPVSKTHIRSTSYDIVTTPADFVKVYPSPSLSTFSSILRRSKEQLASPKREQRTRVQAYTSALDNHKPAQPCLLQTAPDASFVMESRSANTSPHPRQPNTGSNNFFHQEHDGLIERQLDKGIAYPKHRLSEREKYLLPDKLTVESQTPLTAEKETPAVNMHERLQEMQSSNSKKSLFSSLVKRDKEAVFSSSSLPDKEVISPQYLKTKRNAPVFKTNSRIDQMLNRLKLTFGVKRSESLDTLPKKNKSPTQQLSVTETFERPKEKTYSESHLEPSNSSLTTDKGSLSVLKKSENTLNTDGQKSKTEVNYAGCTRWAPNSSLTTDKASIAYFELLSPLPLKRSENTLNTDWQNRTTTEQKGSGSTWEAPNSSLTTNKASFASCGSSSPLTLRRSGNTLNIDWQNRSTTEQKDSGSTWEAPNSSLSTDRASFRSLSPLTLKRSENALNMDCQNRSISEQKGFGSTWEAPNSSLATNKASFRPLSPLALKRSENTSNMDWQNRSRTEQKGSGCTWEAPNSSLTNDKALFGSLSTQHMGSGCTREAPNSSLTDDKASFRSLSPLTLKRSENTLNMDWRNRSTTEQMGSGCTWEASNSSLATDKAPFASFGSLSPLALRKSENTLNMERQNRSTTEQMGSRCTREASNSSLTTDKASFASFGSLSPLTIKKSPENKLNVDQQKRYSDENGNRSYGRSLSPHMRKAQGMSRSATLPHYRKSGPPSPFNLFDFDSEDIQNDNVFYSPVSKKTNSLCESDDFSSLSTSKSPVQQNLVRSGLSSSCADLKYGLQYGRSFSVSSVVSSRPSGPGRISTSSISDLSSLDDFVPKGSYTVVDSPTSSSLSPIYNATVKQSQPGYRDDYLDHNGDPTPPPSPTMSSSPRRISQALSVSSPKWTSPESLSPRGLLPSRTSLTVFEESDSDTTTDDEYYLDNGGDDAVETEL